MTPNELIKKGSNFLKNNNIKSHIIDAELLLSKASSKSRENLLVKSDIELNHNQIKTYNYLIFPKIVALSLYPFVIGISMFLGILGGYIACVYGGWTSSSEFIEGIQLDFIPFHITYAFIKTVFFSFILATIPSYHGYFMKGGALQVGKASTISFVWTSVTIIIINYLITQSLLA